MMNVTMARAGARPQAGQAAIAPLVEALGSAAFGPALARYLNGLCGADHFAAFQLRQQEVREVAACCVQPEQTARDRVDSYVGGWWRHDPALEQARRCLAQAPTNVIHMDLAHESYCEIRPRVYPHVSDRLLVCGRTAELAFGLSVLRQQPNAPFAAGAMDDLAESAGLLVALLSKHCALARAACSASEALRSLDRIESCIGAGTPLPRREAEVCARILFGLSSAGIALDLRVSEETVKTYRKRAYQRLAIGSERELLNWYLARWGDRGGTHAC